MARADEQVLVVDRALLFPDEAFSGVLSDGVADYLTRIAAGHRWLARSLAERDETVKQVIPYCVVRNEAQVFLTRRLKAQAEVRLHDLYSIGIGGHMNSTGATELSVLINENLARELAEELVMPAPAAIRLIGAINDDSTSVSRCHFGLLYEVTVQGEVAIRETDKMVGRWAALSELAPGTELYAACEDWSRHAATVLLAARTQRQEG